MDALPVVLTALFLSSGAVFVWGYRRAAVVRAPYPDLPAGQSLDFTAWNKLQTCPATITADQARAVAYGFEYAFSCTGNAPEPKAAGNGC